MIVMAAFLATAGGIASAVESFATMLWIISIGYVGVALVHFAFVIASAPRLADTAPMRELESRRW